MTSYLNMAWWLADSLLNGTMDKDYPVKTSDTVDDLKNGEGIYYGDNYGYEYTHIDSGEPFSQDFLSDNDDNAAHHFNLNNEVQQSKNMANYFKYHEEEILKDIEEYVSSTYRGHYTGTQHEYRNVQTIDLT